VAHLITSLSVGGAETFLLRLVATMDRGRFDPVVISVTDEGTLGAQLREMGVRVYALGMRRGVPHPGGLIRLISILRRERPHILQTWLYHADLLGLLARRPGAVERLVWGIRCSETDSRYRSGLSGLVVRILARYSDRPDAIVTNSQAGTETHRAMGYRPRRWEVIHNGVDTDHFHPAPGHHASVRRELDLPPETVLIGLVARYDPLKDHGTFLKAAAHLANEKDVHFVLAGAGVDGANGVLAQLAGELGISQRVHFLGERTDIARLNAAFDIASCCSTGEGFPNILIEAMACGVPCVTTDVGDAREVVAETGIVSPVRGAAQLAQGWRTLLQRGSDGRAQLGQAARDRIVEHFALSKAASRYETLYSELACAKPEPAEPR